MGFVHPHEVDPLYAAADEAYRRALGDRTDDASREAAYLTALAEVEAQFGPTHPNLLGALYFLGSFLGDEDSDPATAARARPYWARLLEIECAVYGFPSRDVGGTVSNIAEMLLAADAIDDAIALYHWAIAIYRALDVPAPNLRVLLTNLGTVLFRKRYHLEALPIALQAAEIGDDGSAWNLVGNLYSGLGDLERAESAFRHAVELGGDHQPDVVAFNLATTFDARGRDAEALPWYERAYRGRIETEGLDDEAIGRGELVVGALLRLGRNDDARAFASSVMDLVRAKPGTEFGRGLTTMRALEAGEPVTTPNRVEVITSGHTAESEQNGAYLYEVLHMVDDPPARRLAFEAALPRTALIGPGYARMIHGAYVELLRVAGDDAALLAYARDQAPDERWRQVAFAAAKRWDELLVYVKTLLDPSAGKSATMSA